MRNEFLVKAEAMCFIISEIYKERDENMMWIAEHIGENTAESDEVRGRYWLAEHLCKEYENYLGSEKYRKDVI